MKESRLSHLVDPLREMIGQYDIILNGYRERNKVKIAGLSSDIVPAEILAALGIIPLRIPVIMGNMGICSFRLNAEEKTGVVYDMLILPEADKEKYSDMSIPVYDFRNPGGYGEEASVGLHNEIDRFLGDAGFPGIKELDAEKLQKIAEGYNDMRRLVRGISSTRRDKPHLLSNDDMLIVFEACAVFPPSVVMEYLVNILNSLKSSEEEAGPGLIPVMVYGSPIRDCGVLDSLEDEGLLVVEDDHEDFKISMELKLEGIGVRLRTEDGFVIVESIITGGATDKLPEDLILKPNDKIVAVAQAKGEPVDVIDMDLRDVVKKIRGKKGTEVRLTILRDSEENSKSLRKIVPIIREEIKLQDSDAESDVHTMSRNGRKDNIGYINLPSFYQDSARNKSSAGDMRLHIERLIKKNVKGIILDLRGNPGGLLNEAIEIAGLFIDRGPIVQIKDGRNPPHVIHDNDNGIFYDGPVVILIDKFSASASEILAGAIKDYKRGVIIGPGNTFGKGTVQSYNVLPFEKGAIKVTTHIFYQPAGTSNQLNGIKPDIRIPALSSIWDIGEDKTKYPLKWKKIKSANFKRYNSTNPAVISNLKKKSIGRINSSREFSELIKKIDKFKKQVSNKTISLKEESNIEKQKKKELEKTIKKDRDKKIIDLKNDLFLKEAFNITHDYIQIINK